MATTPERPRTCTGVVLLTAVPAPSWPEPFRPQAQTVPPAASARLCKHPAATATTPGRPLTAAGVALSVALPLPSSPCPFAPQAHAAPGIVAAGAAAGR